MTELQRKIAEVDFQLITAGDRLKQYREHGPGTSVIVQRGVCDRLLDVRLVLMAERDAQAGRAEL